MSLVGIVALVLAAAVGGVWLVSYVISRQRSNPIIDLDVQDKHAGYISSSAHLHAVLGQVGEASTDLRPQGYVLISGRRYDAQTQGGEYVYKGTPVEVIGLSGQFLVVRQTAPPQQLAGQVQNTHA